MANASAQRVGGPSRGAAVLITLHMRISPVASAVNGLHRCGERTGGMTAAQWRVSGSSDPWVAGSASRPTDLLGPKPRPDACMSAMSITNSSCCCWEAVPLRTASNAASARTGEATPTFRRSRFDRRRRKSANFIVVVCRNPRGEPTPREHIGAADSGVGVGHPVSLGERVPASQLTRRDHRIAYTRCNDRTDVATGVRRMV